MPETSDSGALASVMLRSYSYGGWQSWLLALSQNQIMMPNGQLVPWRSPAGVPIRLAAAVPQFTWTDLAQALVDNGRASDGYFGAPPNGPYQSPYGRPGPRLRGQPARAVGSGQ